MHNRYLLFVLPTIFAILALFSGHSLVSGAAPIIYVDADAVAVPDGLSWTTAYTNVQSALGAAVSGYEIWVAEGIYYPDEGFGQTNDDITSTFVLTDGVALYGGFDPGSGVDTFSQRDWETYVTVLSGDIDENDTTDLQRCCRYCYPHRRQQCLPRRLQRGCNQNGPYRRLFHHWWTGQR